MSFINPHQLISYLKYYRKAKTINSVHSPYVYRLLMECLENEKEYYAYADVNRFRYHLAADRTEFEIKDLGAGSKRHKSNKRRISDILHSSVLNHREGTFLYNLTRILAPKVGLELGTSLGISALYLCLGHSDLVLHTIEGDKSIHEIASSVMTVSGVNAHCYVGPFDDILPELLPQVGSLDLVYIDGNHTYKSTLDYHRMIGPYLSDRAVIIYDDIYWSAGMTRAWKELIDDSNFQITIDLFDFGLLIKHRETKNKQHFTIIERKKKPFNMGFWG